MMKRFGHKVAYIAGGIIIGIVFSTTAGAFADQLKSLVGKKVTGEYTIVVDGKKLSDKGAVIDSKANVPARALSEALGAEVSVEGKTINITSVSKTDQNVVIDTKTNVNNKYIGDTKSSLEQLKSSILANILNPTIEGRNKIQADIEELNTFGAGDAVAAKEKQLAQYNADIEKYEAELKLIDEALLTAK
ncbi:stalk domain-containing protein [Paenibacillus silvae]|nr:copper amine oxidase [Paenibacillus silvae]